MKKLMLMLLGAIASPSLIGNNVTLHELAQYAQKHPELAKPDNLDPFDPNYETFYRSFGTGAIKKIIPFWPIKPYLLSDYKAILTEVISQRKKLGLTVTDGVRRIQANEPISLIIWGNLHGAFHSLIRALTYLESKGIINNNLTITKPNYYMIFNGNAITNSPYSIETLITIFKLMQANPGKVIYIKGADEENWQNKDIVPELKIKVNYSDEELYNNDDTQESIVTLTNTFFNSIPQAIYINTPQDPYQVIRIAPESNTEVEENSFGTFFESSNAVFITHELTDKQPTPKPVSVIANIKSSIENIIKPFYGLGLLLEQDYGAPNWAIFSSPTLGYQKEYNFFNDAFVVLNVTTPITNSTLRLYSQDSRTKKGFIASKPQRITFNEQRNKKKDIIIGSSISLLSGVPSMGTKTKTGIEARINEQNKKGGINGHRLKLIILNDNYTPFLARKNIEKFINSIKADLILLPVGSPTLGAYLDYIKDNKLTVLFPVTGGPQFRDTELPGMVHMRASYTDEVRALVNYILKEYNLKNFAVFYQNDDYGIPPLEITKEVLKEKEIPAPLELPYPRGATNFELQIKKIKEAEPNAIGFFSTGQAAQEFIRQLGVDFLANKKLFGLSFMASPEFKKFAKKHGIDFLAGAVLPNPKTSQLPIVQQYRKAMDSYGKSYDVHSLEAYIATDLLLSLIAQIREPFTTEKLIKKLESLHQYNHKGITFSFDPTSRSLAQYVWIDTGPDKEWQQIKL